MRHTTILPFALGCALSAQAADLKDPTRPPVITSVTAKPMAEPKLPPQVTAIFLSSSRRIAVFNGQPVHAGDVVGVYRIDEVTAQGVHYSASGHAAFAPLAVAVAAVAAAHPPQEP
jgi:hypothetical protein